MRAARVLVLCVLAAALSQGAEPPLAAVRVCELFENAQAYAGGTFLLVGRFSFRDSGRFLSEASCAPKTGAALTWPPALRIVIDGKAGPKSPERLAVDFESVSRKLALVMKSTALAKFRFGSTDYDRWAAVYGRIELVSSYAAGPGTPRKGEFEPLPGRIVCRGESLIIPITDGE